ncbi:hypothetical protein LOZ57_003865 [Ophidiomyces ophidiicola]|uniref:uncharacterized protein n=1 Tax=Ophidiomyces ophidiicola TaxID=1387563 RepID=UPI0020C21CAC|nr:uncharacterized protein LOZ57_003865 [Ophidiomyces ophidiicola]KAI1946114.1 hypothetical protein LOZ57_003865 [Ophidiomyces ophidiicola]KAI2050093.1 hypothetical protein LOZ43_004985 [Ophidiomyces ophidiicola]
MASPFCRSCLSKLRNSSVSHTPSTSIPRIAAAPFHSTSSVYALPTKKSRSQDSGPKFREARSARIKRKASNIKQWETPAERKAQAHRLVLSNPNALNVPLTDFSLNTMTDTKLHGQTLGIPMNLIENLRALRAFKVKQGWNMFRRPGTLMRTETFELANLMTEIKEKQAVEATAKVVTGDRAVGKSVYLLQAMTIGLLDKWVVISIPDAGELVNGTTAYSPLPGSQPTQYVQKTASAQLLERIAKANEAVLSKLHVSSEHPQLKKLFNPKMSLAELATIGSQQPEMAWPVFQALWSELTATSPTGNADSFTPFKPRPPMLVTIDGIAHWMHNTTYKNPDFKPIHAYDLVFVKHFLSLTSSPASSMPNGGLVLCATSTSNNPSVLTFKAGLNHLSTTRSHNNINPNELALEIYGKSDPRVISFFEEAKGLRRLNLGGLSKYETKCLLEYLARSGIMRKQVTPELVSEKWGLSGGGVIGELERLGKRILCLPRHSQLGIDGILEAKPYFPIREPKLASPEDYGYSAH